MHYTRVLTNYSIIDTSFNVRDGDCDPAIKNGEVRRKRASYKIREVSLIGAATWLHDLLMSKRPFFARTTFPLGFVMLTGAPEVSLQSIL